MFELHPKLREDGISLGRFPLCRVLLMNDSAYPWFVLVPEREGVAEIHQLSEADQAQLIREISQLSQAAAEIFRADKINVAALGNVVPQLHVHVVARFRNDPAWPAPVWGKQPATPYREDEMTRVRNRVRERLGDALRPITRASLRENGGRGGL